ncbi:hypothetical protein CVT24_012426 [Panaeolus cyanescens]|uniref:Uncharacterized protein n=1 Tax=Panaeolus cyanescens TaxID=181874 RepID=A0A409WUB2_9AGAR|nr:hypothetical protein CVT24_012426 [Panaeolus cyanescens]
MSKPKREDLVIDNPKGFQWISPTGNLHYFATYRHGQRSPSDKTRWAVCDRCDKPISLSTTLDKRWFSKHRNAQTCPSQKPSEQQTEVAGARLAVQQLKRGELEYRDQETASGSSTPTTSTLPLFSPHSLSHTSNTSRVPSLSPLSPGLNTSNVPLTRDHSSPSVGTSYSVDSIDDNVNYSVDMNNNTISLETSPLHSSNYTVDLENQRLSQSVFSRERYSLLLPASEHDACTGQLIEWIGPVHQTYSLQLHAAFKVPWTISGIESDTWIRIHSSDCLVILETDLELHTRTCTNCASLTTCPQLLNAMKRAQEVELPPETRYDVLNFLQLRSLLKRKDAENERLRLELKNRDRELSTAQHAKHEALELRVFMAHNNIPAALRHLLTSLNRRESAKVTLVRLKKAMAGTLTSRQKWLDFDLDKAQLTRILGGRRLVYALSKADGSPSLSSLYRLRPIPEIVPSASRPTRDECSINISNMLGPSARPVSVTSIAVGQALMIDDTAIEEVARYDPNQNCVVGLCREHLHSLKLNVDVDKHGKSVLQLKDALKNGRCHYGKEVTVVAIAPITGPNHYYASPLLVSASCKTEKADEFLEWISDFLDVYEHHDDGEKRHGQIHTIFTDGASTFRKARFSKFLTEELDPNSPIGKIICPLTGFDCMTGLRGRLGSCDFKHIIKRFATSLRSPKGIIVNTTVLYPSHIREALDGVEGLTPEKAKRCINPADKQNVPAAVEFLQILIFDLPNTHTSSAPSEAIGAEQRLKAIKFVAKFMSYFLLPFIDVDMSLSDQILSLSIYSWLAIMMYDKHKLDFIGGAIYADSQAVVKNIIFTTARLQVNAPGTLYFIIQDGTDREEEVFSDTRTLDHDRNVDAIQFTQKSALATQARVILQRNPKLDPGHRRRELKGVRGVDRINPASWNGDVNVDHVCISELWFKGKDEAQKIIQDFFGPDFMDFDSFEQRLLTGEINMLKPGGDYVGTRKGDEDPINSVPDADLQDLQPLQQSDLDISSQTVAAADSELEQLECETPNVPTGTIDNLDDLESPASNSDTDCDSDIGELNPPPTNTPRGTNIKHCIIKHDGTLVSKAKFIAQELMSPSSARKSSDRSLRVQGFRPKDFCLGNQDAILLSDEQGISFKTAQPGAIVSLNLGRVVIVPVEIIHFRKGSSKNTLTSVLAEDFRDISQNYTVSLQALELERHTAGPHMGHSSNMPSTSKPSWNWTGNYIPIHPASKTSSAVHKSQYILTVQADQFIRLFPALYEINGVPTWAFDHDALFDAMQTLWLKLRPNENELLAALKSLPETYNTTLPYRTETHELAIPLDEIPIDLKRPKLGARKKVQCFICGKDLAIKDMRYHVGIHIITHNYNVPDPLLPSSTSPSDISIGYNPCGFCGQSEAGCFTILILKTNRAQRSIAQIESSCPYHFKNMEYTEASVSNLDNPCSNVPIHCSLCPVKHSGQHPTIWKYNFTEHMIEHHQKADRRTFVDCSPDLLRKTHISVFEATAMGVRKEAVYELREDMAMHNSSSLPGSPEMVKGVVKR